MAALADDVRELGQPVGGLVENGTTVFLTTQYLEEADRLVRPDGHSPRRPDRGQGTSDELKATVPRGRATVRSGLTASSQNDRPVRRASLLGRPTPFMAGEWPYHSSRD
jgi:hypothetical protein